MAAVEGCSIDKDDFSGGEANAVPEIDHYLTHSQNGSLGTSFVTAVRLALFPMMRSPKSLFRARANTKSLGGGTCPPFTLSRHPYRFRVGSCRTVASAPQQRPASLSHPSAHRLTGLSHLSTRRPQPIYTSLSRCGSRSATSTQRALRT